MEPGREAHRVHPHQPPADGRRAGLATFDPPQQRAQRRLRRAHHRHQGLSVPRRARGPDVPARRPPAAMADGGPAVLHAPALHAARADGLRGPRGRDRPRRLRGRRDLAAPDPRHGRQGADVPRAQGAEGPRVQRDAARLREAPPLADSGAVRRDVREQARLHEVDLAQARAARDDRPARARVERLRPPRRQDQAAAQHQALEPAVEDRPAGRLHAGREQRLRAAQLAAPRARRRCSAATPCSAPTRPIPTPTRSVSSSACCGSAWSRA